MVGTLRIPTPPDLPSHPHSGMKRVSTSEDIDRPGSAKKPKLEKRIVKHYIRHKQEVQDALGLDTTLAPHDEEFIQGQLTRAITIALSAVGFESVKSTALEMFRGQVEEYMLHFLSSVKVSMESCRRTQPIPQDFAYSLAKQGIFPSSLLPQLDLPIPPSVSQPTLPAPDPPDPAPPNLEPLLGAELSCSVERSKKRHIPKHFPSFPSKHTWVATPVYTEREKDPRKIREQATQEGLLAEQALRKLMAASKAGGGGILRKLPNRQTRRDSSLQDKAEDAWKSTMEELGEKEDEGATRNTETVLDFGLDGAAPEPPRKIKSPPPFADDGILVNHESRFWRQGRRLAGPG